MVFYGGDYAYAGGYGGLGYGHHGYGYGNWGHHGYGNGWGHGFHGYW